MRSATQRGSPRYVLVLVSVLALLGRGVAMAENVDPAAAGSQYAWGENLGWLNAEPQGEGGPGIEVSDTAVTGWIWAGSAGWISLSCQNTGSCGDNDYGVVNDEKGNLSGYAWGEHIGWISFRTGNGSDCCVNDGTPGCTDSACETAICAADPYCCNNNWNQQCADEASAEAACSANCAATPFGVRIHGFTGKFSGHAWAEKEGWINFGSPDPAAATQIETGWRCSDPDADGVCSASDSCPTFSNSNQQTVRFGQTVRAQNEVDFVWPTAVEFEMARGTFTTSASVGTWASLSSETGSGAVFTDNGTPSAGFGFWYLFRPGCAAGSYSTGSPRERPGRDAALIP